MRPKFSNSVARCDLTADKLLGAAMCPVLVADLAWLGRHCCVKYTKMFSGVAVCKDLLLEACSQCASSLTAAVLAFLVESLTDFC